MSECEFKYGDKVEVRDWDNEEWVLRTFLAYQPAHDFPYFCGDVEESEIYAWNQARKPLPKIKPGHPIAVMGFGNSWVLRWFERFDKNGQPVDSLGHTFFRYKLLPNYDYSADPPKLEE